MGVCSSSLSENEKEIRSKQIVEHRRIEESLKKEANSDITIIKLLLLGKREG